MATGKPLLNIKIVRVPAIMEKVITLQPELTEALETIGARLERKGKGLGERRNQVNRERALLSQRIGFEISHYPRRTGAAKIRKMRTIFKGMSGRVIKKMVQRIEARWAETSAR